MLWLEKFRPQEAQEDPSAQSLFENGVLVGNLAKGLLGPYEEATVVKDDGSQDQNAMLLRTRELMESDAKNIAEAAFLWDGNYCAVDILHRTNDGWAIYEVKSSSDDEEECTVKDLLPYLRDVAYQKYVLEKSGIRVSGTYLVRLNKNYVRGAELDIQQLFVITDLKELLTDESANVANNIALAKQILQQSSEPDTEMGKQCRNPYDCDFQGYCMNCLLDRLGLKADIDNETTVLNFYRMAFDKKVNFLRQGKVRMDQMDDEDTLTDIQRIQVRNYVSRSEPIDKAGIRNFLDENIRYPLYFLDFETAQYAVPQFKDSRPYQQIPFQYSLHYIERKGGELKHKDFLGDGVSDPRRALAEQLVSDIPLNACTTAYNKSFECGRIKDMADLFPDLSEHLLNIRDHVVDFLDPFRAGYYYNEAMRGSFSIKKVLPALFPNDPELDYHNLKGGVQNGEEAMNVYPQLAIMSEEDREATRKALLEYCKLDTFAMVKIWQKLEVVSQSK